MTSEDCKQLRDILLEHPALHDGGYGPSAYGDDDANRVILATSIEEFVTAREWIAQHFLPTARINSRRSSYGMKHVMERESGYYVTNGVFIAAMLANGYRMKRKPFYNPSFNVAEFSVRQMELQNETRRKAARH